VRLALIRLGSPLRIEIPDHRGLEIILDNDSWSCIDITHGDQLIMVLSEFDTSKHNTALFEPVTCQLHLYHMQAGLIMGSALDALDRSLVEKLATDDDE